LVDRIHGHGLDEAAGHIAAAVGVFDEHGPELVEGDRIAAGLLGIARVVKGDQNHPGAVHRIAGGAAGFACDLDSRIAPQDGLEALPEQGVVVNDQNAFHFQGPACRRR
jgi:hypothetical protein